MSHHRVTVKKHHIVHRLHQLPTLIGGPHRTTSSGVAVASLRIQISATDPIVLPCGLKMTRGDQRERDRAKRQAKEASKNKGNSREGTPLQRNQDDAAKLAAKVAAKQAKVAEEAATTGTSTGAPVPKKKVDKKADNLDDLLLAGLGTEKKNKK
jgi:hypothetical protein